MDGGEPVCSAYFVTRLLLGGLDFTSDLVLASLLLASGHTGWAGAIFVWILAGFIVAVVAVVAGRWSHGRPMSAGKFFLLSFRFHVELTQAFCQSGPQLVTQLAMLWSGVTFKNSDNFAGPPSWAWAAAWGELFAIILSFSSLLVTAARYNREPGPSSRQMFASLALIATCLYRATIISVMVKLAPLLSCLLLTGLASITAAALTCWGGVALPSICQAACSLLIPLGHSLNTPIILAKVPGGIPEAERSRINMEELLRKTRKVFALHSIVSLLLLVPYFTFLEPSSADPSLTPCPSSCSSSHSSPTWSTCTRQSLAGTLPVLGTLWLPLPLQDQVLQPVHQV